MPIYEIPYIGDKIEQHGPVRVLYSRSPEQSDTTPQAQPYPRMSPQCDPGTPISQRTLTPRYQETDAVCEACGKPYRKITLTVCGACHDAERRERQREYLRKFRARQKAQKMRAVFGGEK